MDGSGVERVRLNPWSEGDFWLLRRANSPEMTEHLGGPESEQKLADRQRRYVEPFAGRMYRITLADGGESVGSIGYWEREWRGGTVWETGWGILPEFQGRGLAATAARVLVDVVRQAGGHDALHAFPAVDHPASNGVCRKAGFTLLGQADLEYPKGNWIRSNDWFVDLRTGSVTGSTPGSATDSTTGQDDHDRPG
ncbi:N-acetyltransferase GCN5 [Streptomyces humidus]|uniref:N-acetyltransferase GCN5 n=1 Tax=Streptomyces humidus TaxID=52259 RepID=A0A918FWX2_9ACTN|nr:GNAT family N-acetyltransferase [Streptomyces humidus]GGR90230.1 N-acetyltransferase GCN5 [Streptomyces humidus]